VNDLSASLEVIGDRNEAPLRIGLSWRFEVGFTGMGQYYEKCHYYIEKYYPDFQKENKHNIDILDYVRRAIPFQIGGGTLVSKAYVLAEGEEEKQIRLYWMGREDVLRFF
jgi:hypothetical protein